jgi:hypothetical protein
LESRFSTVVDDEDDDAPKAMDSFTPPHVNSIPFLLVVVAAAAAAAVVAAAVVVVVGIAIAIAAVCQTPQLTAVT